MKRFLSCLLSAAMILTFCACSGQKSTESPAGSSAASESEGTAAVEKVSAPGQYSGYSEAEYDEFDYERHSQYVEMSDGVKIAVDYYIPTKDGVAETKPLPVVFHLTPYGRTHYEDADYGISPYAKDGLDPDCDGDLDQFELLQYGYVLAIAEVRGTGASYGTRVTTNSRREAKDGAEIIEWLAAQSFCDGKVATVGYSYTGQTQLEMISMKPEHLVASTVAMTDYNKYDGWFRNGVPRAFGTQPDTQWGDTPEEVEETVKSLVAETVPVDEDPDGTMMEEAIREHQGSLSQIELFKTKIWRNSFCEETNSELWNEVSASTYKDDINDSGVAIYCFGGDYDVFRRDTIMMYHNLTTPKKLLMGSWYHIEEKEDIPWGVEMHRWFDYWLKGIDNGVITEDPITIKVANYNFAEGTHQGEGTGYIMTTDVWPIDEGTRETLYLADGTTLSGSSLDDGILTNTEPETATVEYDVKYGTKTSVETQLTTNENGTGVDQLAKTFTGAPLTEDKEIIGHPYANVSISLEDAGWMTENLDTDVFVFLSDYDPETDEAFLITEGHIRASLRAESDNCPYDFLSVPWHEDNVGSNEYLELGEAYDLSMDMMPTAYTVKAGHCLRVTVSACCDRMYYLGRDQYEADPDVKTPKINILLGKDHNTNVILPNIYN